jgi:hypothetical protein
MSESSSKRVCIDNPINKLPILESIWDTITKPLSNEVLEQLSSDRVILNPPFGLHRGVKSAYVLVPYGTARRLAGYPVRMINYDGVERRILDANGVTRARVNEDGYVIPDVNYLEMYRDFCQSVFGSDDYVAIRAWDNGDFLETYEPSLPEDADYKVLGLNMVMCTNDMYPPCLRICP